MRRIEFCDTEKHWQEFSAARHAHEIHSQGNVDNVVRFLPSEDDDDNNDDNIFTPPLC